MSFIPRIERISMLFFLFFIYHNIVRPDEKYLSKQRRLKKGPRYGNGGSGHKGGKEEGGYNLVVTLN
jgi:hypothetical protein